MYRSRLLLKSLTIVGAGILAVALWGSGQGNIEGVTPLGTVFTYQGQLKSALSGGPVNLPCDFEFSLWDDPTGPNQVGTTQTISNVPVEAGLFTVALNANGEFDPTPFDGNVRWLQIAVRCPAGGKGPFTTLSPRQEITPAPQSMYTVTAGNAIDADHALEAESALFAETAPWSGLLGVPPGFADKVDDTSGDPIGSVTAWLKSFPGVPALSEEWVECNGQVLNDPASPFDGQAIPNLNTSRFLRGSIISGGIGGSVSHGHGGACACDQGNVGAANASASHIPPFYEVVWIMKVK